MRPRAIGVLFGVLGAFGWARADDLVTRTLPANGDRATYRAPITIHFGAPIELDSTGDGLFTVVRSTSIEADDSDIAVAVNDPVQRNRVRFERDDDNDPLTPGGSPVAAAAAWELSDYPPLLRVVPAQPLDRDRVYRVIVFEGADPGQPSARRVSDGTPAASHTFTFRTIAAGLKGTVQHKTFVPPSLGFTEECNIYLPPGYDGTAAQRYPVLYLLHGGLSDYTSWNAASYTANDGGRAAEIADRLIDGGNIEPLILVMPDGNGGPNKCVVLLWHHLFSNDYTGAFKYGDYASKDLPDNVEARFAAQPDRSWRGVAGLSMGGFGTASVAWGHKTRFAFAAPLSAWEYSVAMTTAPAFPACNAGHWTTITDFGTCTGAMLQAAIGPAGSSDLTHMRTVNGRDLASAVTDADYRGAIFVGHGIADTTATVSWSDDVSCALSGAGAAHCYKRPPTAGHTWPYWNQAFEFEVLPRFHSLTRFAPLPAGINGDCVNEYVQPLADIDLDGIYDDGNRSGIPGDAPCAAPGSSCDDNCRDVTNATQLDTDHDGAGDACDSDQDGDSIPNAADCAPLLIGQGRPPDLAGLSLAGRQPTHLSWAATPTAETYDVSRGLLSGLSSGGYGSCVARGLVTPQWDDSGAAPAPGAGFGYLVRGVDTGCGGSGSWGTTSSGTERGVSGCP